MSRQQLIGPLSIVLAGIIVITLLLAGSSASASVIPQHGTPTWTPCPEDGSNPVCEDTHDQATLTAEALTEAANGYPADTATSSGYPSPRTGTSATTATSSVTATVQTRTGTPATSTQTLSQTVTQTGTPVTTTRSATPLPTTAAPEEQPTAEATPTPADALTCTPGVPIEITGEGPPRAPLLMYFGDRPVGGGSVAPNGAFALQLTVGQERPGDYKVTVRVRGTSQALRQVTCSVPLLAPTPLPAAEP
jgi:hypothetical protein